MLVFFRLDLNHVSVRKTMWQAGSLKKKNRKCQGMVYNGRVSIDHRTLHCLGIYVNV